MTQDKLAEFLEALSNLDTQINEVFPDPDALNEQQLLLVSSVSLLAVIAIELLNDQVKNILLN